MFKQVKDPAIAFRFDGWLSRSIWEMGASRKDRENPDWPTPHEVTPWCLRHDSLYLVAEELGSFDTSRQVLHAYKAELGAQDIVPRLKPVSRD
jgi:hypothetical protein